MYTLVLVGGTGQRFGLTIGLLNLLGCCALPDRTVILDAEGSGDTAGNPVTDGVDQLLRWGKPRAAFDRVPPYPKIDAKGGVTIGNCVSTERSDLFPLCVTEDEARKPLTSGFYANPKVAAIVFRALVQQKGNRLEQLLGAEGAVPPQQTVVIVGSVAGGTGAGILREVARAYANKGAQRIVGIVFTRYFDLAEGRPNTEDLERNAKLGCQYLLRPEGRRWFQALAFVGPPPEVKALSEPGSADVGAPHPFPGFLAAASLLSDGGVSFLTKALSWIETTNKEGDQQPTYTAVCGARKGAHYLRETDLEFPLGQEQAQVVPGDVLRDAAHQARIELGRMRSFDLTKASSRGAFFVRTKLGEGIFQTLKRISQRGQVGSADIGVLQRAFSGSDGVIDSTSASLECLRGWLGEMGDPGKRGGLELAARSPLLRRGAWRESLEVLSEVEQVPHRRFAEVWCRQVGGAQWRSRRASEHDTGDSRLFPYLAAGAGTMPASGVFERCDIEPEQIVLPNDVAHQSFPSPFGGALAFDTQVRARRGGTEATAETLWLALAIGWLDLRVLDLRRSQSPFDGLAASIEDRARFSGLLRVRFRAGMPESLRVLDGKLVGASHPECGLWPGVRAGQQSIIAKLREQMTELDRQRGLAVVARWATLIEDRPDDSTDRSTPSWALVVNALLADAPAPASLDDVRTVGPILLRLPAVGAALDVPMVLLSYEQHRGLKVDGYLATRRRGAAADQGPRLTKIATEGVETNVVETLAAGYLHWDSSDAPIVPAAPEDVVAGRVALDIDRDIVDALDLDPETSAGPASARVPDLLWDRPQHGGRRFAEVPSEPSAGESALPFSDLGAVPGIFYHRARAQWIVWLHHETYNSASPVRRSLQDPQVVEVRDWLLRFPENTKFLEIPEVLLSRVLSLRSHDGAVVHPALPVKQEFVDLVECTGVVAAGQPRGDGLSFTIRFVGGVTSQVSIRETNAVIEERLHVEVWPKVDAARWQRFWCVVETDAAKDFRELRVAVFACDAGAGHYSLERHESGAGCYSVGRRPRLLWLGNAERGGGFVLFDSPGADVTGEHPASIGIDFGTFRTTAVVNAVGARGIVPESVAEFSTVGLVIADQSEGNASAWAGDRDLLPRISDPGKAYDGMVAATVFPTAVSFAEKAPPNDASMPFEDYGIPWRYLWQLDAKGGLKWADDRLTRDARRAFLRALLVLAVAEACGRGANEIAVRYSFPLAMDQNTRSRLDEDFQAAAGWLKTNVGSALSVLPQFGASESEAGITAAEGDGTWVATLDLGGETLDLGLFSQGEGYVREPLAWESVRLGGNLVAEALGRRQRWDEKLRRFKVMGPIEPSPEVKDDVTRLMLVALEYAARFLAGKVVAAPGDGPEGRIDVVLLGSGWRWHRVLSTEEADGFGADIFRHGLFQGFCDRVGELADGKLKASLTLNTRLLEKQREKKAVALGNAMRDPTDKPTHTSIEAPNGIDEPTKPWWTSIGPKMAFGNPDHLNPSPDFPASFPERLRKAGPGALLEGSAARSVLSTACSRLRSATHNGFRARTAISVVYELLKSEWFPQGGNGDH